MATGHPQADKWQRLAYVQLGAAVLLGAFAVLALTGLIVVPRGGGIAPLLVACINVVLAIRSFRKVHEFP